MASIERTAYPRFKRFMSVRELHVFYTPQPDEIVWAGEAAGSDGRAGQFRGYAASVMGSGAWLKPGYQRRKSTVSWSLRKPGRRAAGSSRCRGNVRFSTDHPGQGHTGRALAVSNSKQSNIRLLTMFREA